jgi:Chaperone of endosialidase
LPGIRTATVALYWNSAGHVSIGTSSANYALTMAGGAYCTGTQWQNASDRNLKENFQPADTRAILEKIVALPVTTWNYKSENDAVKHLGPTAQDFQAAFHLGDSDKSIGTVDEGGVALAAIQGLNQKSEETRAENAALKARLEKTGTTHRREERRRAMKTRESKMENGGWGARSVLECGGTTPLSSTRHVASNQSADMSAHSKTWRWFVALLGFFILTSSFCLRASGQSYSIDWSTIDGGGGTSTNGQYAVSGTIGQPDAGQTMSGGNYSLTGGFWSMIAAVQTPGAPLLTIARSGASVIVSWPSPSTGWKLQQNANALNPADWSNVTDTVQDDGTTKTFSVHPPTGNRFYRLSKP